MAGKWLELLKEIMPRLARVAIPFNPATSPYADIYLDYFKKSSATFGVQVITGPVADMAAFETFAAAQALEPNTGLIPVPSAFMSGHTVEIAAMMARYRLPAISYSREITEAGGLLSYGNDITDNYRRAASFVDKILKGRAQVIFQSSFRPNLSWSSISRPQKHSALKCHRRCLPARPR